jgi:hypothetical protein
MAYAPGKGTGSGVAAPGGRAAGEDEYDEETAALFAAGLEEEEGANAEVIANAVLAAAGAKNKPKIKAVNENARRRINAEIQRQKELLQAMQSTAEASYTATTKQMRRETEAMVAASEAQFAAVQAHMAQLNGQIHNLDKADQARFRALQADNLALSKQMAENHRQIQALLIEIDKASFARDQALMDALNARMADLQALQLRLAGELKGDIAAGIAAIQRKIDDATAGLLRAMDKLNDDIAAAMAENERRRQGDLDRLRRELDEAARRGDEARRRQIQREMEEQEQVTVYTCSSCGGSVHSSRCAANTGGGRTTTIRITRAQLAALNTMGASSDQFNSVGNPKDYRVNIQALKQAGETYEQTLRRVLGQIGYTGV